MENLFYKKLGAGKPILILHGLYGSSDNWISVGKILSQNYEVYLIDLRNHGKSFWSEVHNYDSMSDDILNFCITHNLKNLILIGHSMGGKVAINFTNKNPHFIDKLVIVDISPFELNENAEYKHFLTHKYIIENLLKVKIKDCKNRDEANSQLKNYIKEPMLRQFLLKSLKRDNKNEFYWAINLNSILENLYNLMSDLNLSSNHKIEIPTLFVKGELSDYIDENSYEKIKSIFTDSKIEVIKEAGHWLHYEKQSEFIDAVLSFIS